MAYGSYQIYAATSFAFVVCCACSAVSAQAGAPAFRKERTIQLTGAKAGYNSCPERASTLLS